MSAFVVGTGTLSTTTRVGNVNHEYVLAQQAELEKLTFAHAYDTFVNELYGNHKVVVGNGRAVLLKKKTAYAAVLEFTDGSNAIVRYPNWVKVTNLKHEFKLVCGRVYQPEPKPEV